MTVDGYMYLPLANEGRSSTNDGEEAEGDDDREACARALASIGQGYLMSPSEGLLDNEVT